MVEHLSKLEKPDPIKSTDDAVKFTLANASLGDLQRAAPKATANDSDLKIVDSSGKPSGRQEQLQEFVDGFGKTGKMYADSVGDDARLGKFQDRVESIYQSDYPTFKELSKFGDKLAAKPAPSPDEIGKSLGKIFSDALSREPGRGQDLSDEQNKNLMGALSGFMLAARSTFPADQQQKSVEAMVDALDSELKKSNNRQVHGIVWGDTKEPGMATYPNSSQYDRHNFLP